MFSDIGAVISGGLGNPWVYLPAALALGALHALEPGHAKGLMAAFIVAIRGTVLQAVVLGVSAAVGHSAIVILLAGLGLWLGQGTILAAAEPWLLLISAALMFGLAGRLVWGVYGHDHGHHGHSHDHHHKHQDAHGSHGHEGGCHHPPMPAGAVTLGQIIWFGVSAGLMPCPSALAVLLVCWQMKQLVLGFAMVAAFSVGLGVALVGVGVLAALGQAHVRRRALAQPDGVLGRIATWLVYAPWISACIVALLGVVLLVKAALA